MGDVLPVPTDPIAQARAMLAAGRPAFKAALARLEARAAKRRAWQAVRQGSDVIPITSVRS